MWLYYCIIHIYIYCTHNILKVIYNIESIQLYESGVSPSRSLQRPSESLSHSPLSRGQSDEQRTKQQTGCQRSDRHVSQAIPVATTITDHDQRRVVRKGDYDHSHGTTMGTPWHSQGSQNVSKRAGAPGGFFSTSVMILQDPPVVHPNWVCLGHSFGVP